MPGVEYQNEKLVSAAGDPKLGEVGLQAQVDILPCLKAGDSYRAKHELPHA